MSYTARVLPTIPYEDNFQVDNIIAALKARWLYSIPISIMYFAAVHYGRRYMEAKEAWNMRVLLVLWSGLLAVFSWLGTIRITVFLVISLTEHGVFPTVCGIREKVDSPCWLWLYLFVLSKLPELGDTFFIVVRKSKLHFLHWYHHITVFIYAFYSGAHPRSVMIWYAGMNFAVHALMYTYYTLRAARIHVPRGFAMFVTTCQISQMFVGVAIQIASSYMLYTGRSCDTSLSDIVFGLAIYFSYLVLFAHFFYTTYISKPNQTKTKTK